MNFSPAVLSLLLAGVVVASAASATAAQPQSLPPGAYRVQKAQVVDRNGFEKPMTALTLLIPAGWRTQGGISWQQSQAECGRLPTCVEWRAESPDGLSAIEFIPEQKWTGNNFLPPGYQQTCPNVSIMNVRDYLAWFVPQVRPNARILDYRQRPDFTEQLAHFNRNDSSVGGEMRTWVEGGEVLLAYNHQGRELREIVAVTAIFMLSRMPGLNPGEVYQSLAITTLPGYAVRAPNGQLDFQLAELVRKSIQRDPQWGAKMDEHNRVMTGINRRGAEERHKITMDTQREIAEIHRRSYEDRQAVQDRQHEEFSQVIRGVDTYVDTTSREHIELPNTHNYVWRLNDDSYILTNDINFQPNRDLGIEGRQLEVAP